MIIRHVEPRDDAALASIIRTVMPEFGARGPGFAINDPEVDGMYAAYQTERSAYFVLEEAGRVVGGAGVAPLTGGPSDVCELRKMYVLREARGRGAGKELLARCLEKARAFGFARCYLETLTGMDAAQALYVAMGFTPLDGPMGATGHFGCNRFYMRGL